MEYGVHGDLIIKYTKTYSMSSGGIDLLTKLKLLLGMGNEV